MKNYSRPWLLPFNPLYSTALAVRELRLKRGWEPVQRLTWPVISIGNLSTGGSGKTPLTIELARLLSEAGVNVDILSRGYGRKSEQAARVNPEGSWEEFGDEPLLIARSTGLPVYVARQRYEAGSMAEAEAINTNQPRVHLLDDGFQHRQLHRDIDILLLNRLDWHNSLLPAGNLREPLKAIQRASVVAIPADESELEPEIRATGFAGPIWKIKRTMELNAALTKCGVSNSEPVAAFCGIAHPASFFHGLESAGVQLAARNPYPDHHVYSQSDLQKIIESARKVKAEVLVTTEKDLARLGAQRQLLEVSLPVVAVGLRTEILDSPGVKNWLFEAVKLCSVRCTGNGALNGKSRPATGQLFP